MSGIDTLFFDVGGVYLTNGWDHIAREKAATQFSYHFDTSEQYHQSIVEGFECGRISLEDYLKKVVYFEKRDFTKDDYIHFMQSQSQPLEDNLSVLKKLAQQQKYTLATINNESLMLNQYRIEKFRLAQYFSAFFSSCFVGIMKPDGLIFQRALWITQRKGEACLFVDDREENVKAASACGMRAIHLQQPEDLADMLRSEGVSF